MILTKRTGDLLELAANGEIDVIVHQANLFHTFGAGIAKTIKQKFPYAYDADLRTVKGDSEKLGTYSIGIPFSKDKGWPFISRPFVVNLYSQPTLYPSHTSYDAMFEGLLKLHFGLKPLSEVQTIGFPYMMGCGLADGNWKIVKAIIEAVFEDSRFDVFIVKLPEADTKDLQLFGAER